MSRPFQHTFERILCILPVLSECEKNYCGLPYFKLGCDLFKLTECWILLFLTVHVNYIGEYLIIITFLTIGMLLISTGIVLAFHDRSGSLAIF